MQRRKLSKDIDQHRIWMEDVTLAIQRGTDLIVRNCVYTVDSCGWHQYLGNQRVGPPATIMGLDILDLAERDFQGLSLAKQSLYKDQLEDGGWTIRSINRYSVTESTAWVTYGLQKIGEPLNEKIISGLKWLVKNQNEDGGWGEIKGTDSRVYITFWASSALQLCRLYPEVLYKTNVWLKEIQNRDGGWGETKGKASTVQHTACGVLCLLSCGEVASSGLVQAGVNWLIRNYHQDVLWEWSEHSEEYDIVLGPKTWDRIRLRHYPTQWATIALLEASGGIFNNAVFESIRWLLNTQHAEGYWLHPMIQNQISIWGLHDSIYTLKKFLDGFGQGNEVGHVDLYQDMVVFTKKGTTPSFWKLLWWELKSTISRWIKFYWSATLVILYLLLIYPLYKWFGISIKDILLGIILPLLLVFFQYLLEKQSSVRRENNE